MNDTRRGAKLLAARVVQHISAGDENARRRAQAQSRGSLVPVGPPLGNVSNEESPDREQRGYLGHTVDAEKPRLEGIWLEPEIAFDLTEVMQDEPPGPAQP